MAAVSAIVFCYKGLPSSPVAGKSKLSLKWMSELGKPCHDPGMILYSPNEDDFLGKHPARQPASAVLLLASFLLQQPFPCLHELQLSPVAVVKTQLLKNFMSLSQVYHAL